MTDLASETLGVYGGAQGIWVDKARTASPEIGSDGATNSIQVAITLTIFLMTG